MKQHALWLVLLAALLWPLAGAAAEGGQPPLLLAQQDDAEEEEDPFADDPFETEAASAFDPIEPFNRGMFWFNDKVYFYALKPVAKAFRVVPEPARVSVDNFFSNITSPISIANSLLQFKLKDAGVQFGRLLINSTIGIVGLFDPADSQFNLREKEEDFGQTMGRYGIGAGPYLVLPFLGPSSLRDGLGSVADGFIDPITLLADDDAGIIVGARALQVINAVSLDKDTYESVKKEQLDPYLFVREAYSQNRAAKVSQ